MRERERDISVFLNFCYELGSYCAGTLVCSVSVWWKGWLRTWFYIKKILNWKSPLFPEGKEPLNMHGWKENVGKSELITILNERVAETRCVCVLQCKPFTTPSPSYRAFDCGNALMDVWWGVLNHAIILYLKGKCGVTGWYISLQIYQKTTIGEPLPSSHCKVLVT